MLYMCVHVNQTAFYKIVRDAVVTGMFCQCFISSITRAHVTSSYAVKNINLLYFLCSPTDSHYMDFEFKINK